MRSNRFSPMARPGGLRIHLPLFSMQRGPCEGGEYALSAWADAASVVSDGGRRHPQESGRPPQAITRLSRFEQPKTPLCPKRLVAWQQAANNNHFRYRSKPPIQPSCVYIHGPFVLSLPAQSAPLFSSSVGNRLGWFTPF